MAGWWERSWWLWPAALGPCGHPHRHTRRINTEKRQRTSLFFGWQNIHIQFHAAQLFCTRTILKNRINSSFSSNNPGAIHPILQIIMVQFILFFKSSWCNSSYSPNHPGAMHSILQIILVQFILFFNSSWCNLSYSSNQPGAIYPILQIFLVQFILFFKSSWWKSSYSSNHPGAIHHILQMS